MEDNSSSGSQSVDAALAYQNAGAWQFLCYLLDNLPVAPVRGLIMHLWPLRSEWRTIIGQWLDSDAFSSTYFVETSGLLWDAGSGASRSYEGVILAFSDGVAESKLGPLKRERSFDLEDDG
jgi:hypothetical protein